MARIRTIKPDFFFNEGLSTLAAETRLFFIGLLCQADREGRMEDRPGRLRANIFPYDSGLNAENLVDELVTMKHLQRYEVDGVKVLQISNFSKHQRPHHTEPASVLPAPPHREKTVRQPLSHGEPPLGREGKGKEGKGKEMSVVTAKAATKEETAIQKLVEAYKIAKGVDRDDKGWNKQNFGRYSKAAVSLLDCFKGDLDAAAAYLFVRGVEMDEKKLEWTMETIARQAWDGAGMKQEGSDESGNGKVDDGRTAGRLGSRGFTSSRALAGDALRAIQTSVVRSEKDGELGVPDAID